jgi:peptide/nickel transport system substrate-binding protein/oligopeptide transport system substrate-binding protein
MFLGTRRNFNLVLIVLAAAALVTGCAPAAAPTAAPAAATSTPLPPPPTYTPAPAEPVAAEPTATTAPAEEAAPAEGGIVNAFGVTLPADAAPPEQQYIKTLALEGTTVDFPVSVYKRTDPAYSSVLSVPLVRINKNFELVPAGAESWEVSEDGLTWTFHLDPNLKWSDGTPLTAHDHVATFQYQASPEHAWDFAWFWSIIKNWDDAVAGKVPVTEIGVTAVDDFTLQFTTKEPAPYLPSQALYARPLNKAHLEEFGEYYNNAPETSISASPWILEEWTKGKQMVFGPNKNYTGKEKPYLERFILVFGDPNTDFLAYQNNEVDHAYHFTPADIALISADPVLSAEYHPGFGDFRTHYLGMNTEQPPFNDIKVRQAFAKAIDRQAIIDKVVLKQGIPAYSFLMPGFPDANAEELSKLDVNQYDPEAAKQLLADAGYPDGKGFPKLVLALRQDKEIIVATANAIAAMLKQNLGVEVEVQNQERKVFMDALNAHTLPFYIVSYGYDYLDASNMLGIWTTGGRHAWSNAEFDRLFKEAAPMTGDPEKRSQLFKDAEKILVEDVPAMFIYHETPGWIYRPYLKGVEFEPDRTGVTTWHWPGLEDIGMMALTSYIGKDVENYR